MYPIEKAVFEAAFVVDMTVVPPVPLTALPDGIVEPKIPPTAAHEPAATLGMVNDRMLLPLIELVAPTNGATVVSTLVRVNACMRVTVTVTGFN